MKINEILAHIVCDIADARERYGGRKSGFSAVAVTVIMTNDLVAYLWSKVRGIYAVEKIAEDVTFYGFPVKRVNEAGLKYWIAVKSGEFCAEEESND